MNANCLPTLTALILLVGPAPTHAESGVIKENVARLIKKMAVHRFEYRDLSVHGCHGFQHDACPRP
jgi:hypothetical protein